MAFWRDELWSTCAGVQEGLAAVLYGPWRCRGAKEALGVVRLLCSDTLRVRWCRLGSASPKWTFWSLLGGKEGWLQGLMCGPRSRLALEAAGSLSSYVMPRA
jgi:hypothetical protein